MIPKNRGERNGERSFLPDDANCSTDFLNAKIIQSKRKNSEQVKKPISKLLNSSIEFGTGGNYVIIFVRSREPVGDIYKCTNVKLFQSQHAFQYSELFYRTFTMCT